MKSTLEYALEYAEQGLAVFPCKPKGKAPATKHGFKEATTDKEQIEKWWKNNNDLNIGIATGDMSGGLVVIDLDMHGDERAFDYVKEWESEHGTLPQTWVSKTGSGGWHILYKTDRELRNSANSELCIDIRATGGYIVAPPSLHPAGTAYEWLNHDGDIAEADDNVYQLIQSVAKTNALVKSFVLPNKINRGERNETLFKYACRLQGQGHADEKILEMVQKINEEQCTEPLPKSDVIKLIESVLGRYAKGTPTGDFERNAKAEVIDTLGNITKILENDTRFAGRFYYDERAYRNKVVLPLPWDYGIGERTLQDIDYAQFRRMVENLQNPLNSKEVIRLKAKTQNIIDGFNTVSYDHRRNPLVEYLDSLKWDGTPRLDTALTDFLGVKDAYPTREIMRLIALGAVSRAYHAGTQFDYVPVLVGSQGIGKSQFVKRLCPRDEWYLDNLVTMEGDQAIERLENKWIVEVAELANLRRDKIETVKAFITQTQDTYRPKYGKNSENRQRSVIFIGTTNSTTFLTDPTGNRRWIPLKCGEVKIKRSLWEGSTTSKYFEQIWAEAVNIFKTQDFSLVLDPEAEKALNRLRDEYTSEDPRTGLIEAYLQEELQKYTRTTKGQGELGGLRICLKQIAEEGLDLKDERLFTYNDIKTLVEKIPNWKFNAEKRPCGKYGRQRYYTPMCLDEKTNLEMEELEKDRKRAMEILESKLAGNDEQNDATATDLLLKFAMQNPTTLIETVEGD